MIIRIPENFSQTEKQELQKRIDRAARLQDLTRKHWSEVSGFVAGKTGKSAEITRSDIHGGLRNCFDIDDKIKELIEREGKRETFEYKIMNMDYYIILIHQLLMRAAARRADEYPNLYPACTIKNMLPKFYRNGQRQSKTLHVKLRRIKAFERE